MNTKLVLHGTWLAVHKDANGNVLSEETIENLVVDGGVNYMLNSALHGDTAISPWYVIPFTSNNPVAAGNTYAVPGNTEATGYTEATRREWVEGASTAKSVTNSLSPAVITASGPLTIYGFGIVGGGSAASTKGDTAGGGTMLSAGLFDGGIFKTLAATETLTMTYTLSVA